VELVNEECRGCAGVANVTDDVTELKLLEGGKEVGEAAYVEFLSSQPPIVCLVKVNAGRGR
jgi:hypothetical protein